MSSSSRNISSDSSPSDDSSSPRAESGNSADTWALTLAGRIPVDENGVMTSIGSIFHQQGGCKPCRFHNHPAKPEGCHYGIGCLFCHFHHVKKRRPKPKCYVPPQPAMLSPFVGSKNVFPTGTNTCTALPGPPVPPPPSSLPPPPPQHRVAPPAGGPPVSPLNIGQLDIPLLSQTSSTPTTPTTSRSGGSSLFTKGESVCAPSSRLLQQQHDMSPLPISHQLDQIGDEDVLTHNLVSLLSRADPAFRQFHSKQADLWGNSSQRRISDYMLTNLAASVWRGTANDLPNLNDTLPSFYGDVPNSREVGPSGPGRQRVVPKDNYVSPSYPSADLGVLPNVAVDRTSFANSLQPKIGGGPLPPGLCYLRHPTPPRS